MLSFFKHSTNLRDNDCMFFYNRNEIVVITLVIRFLIKNKEMNINISAAVV